MLAGLRRFALPALLVLLTALVLLGHESVPQFAVPAEISFCSAQEMPSSLAEAQQCNYLPRDQLSRQLLTQPVKWARVKINTSTLPTRELAIMVSPHFVSWITLYTPVDSPPKEKNNLYEAAAWRSETAGSAAPAPNPASVLGGYLFVVSPPATTQALVSYIRIESFATPYVAVDVQPWPSATIQNQVWVGAYLGTLLLILVFSCFSLALDANMLMQRFVIYISTVFLSVLTGSGFLAIYLFTGQPAILDSVFQVLLCLRLTAWIWLAMGFLKSYQTPTWYRGFCMLVLLVSLACMALPWTTLAGTVLPMLMGCLILASLVQIWVVLRTADMAFSVRVVLASGYGLTLFLMLCLIASTILPHQSALLPIQVIRLVDFMPPLLLLAMVVFKNRQARLELALMHVRLSEAHLQAEVERTLLEERRMLVDMLTHELKNPLASISFAADSLAHDDNPQDKARRLRNIQLSIENMDTVIERCSLVNTLEQATFTTAPSLFDLTALIQSLVDASAMPQRVRLGLEQNLMVNSDRNLVRIVCSNLLDNALKYAPADSLVDITACNTEGLLTVAFSNAIDPLLMPDAHALFARFYRHANVHHISGTGLGLYLVHELCQRLGGSVTFTPHDHSVTFEVSLPYDN